MRICSREASETEPIVNCEIFESILRLFSHPIVALPDTPEFEPSVNALTCCLRSLTNVVHVVDCVDLFVESGGLNVLLDLLQVNIRSNDCDNDGYLPLPILYFATRMLYMLCSKR
jgi:hypothetical protein